MKLIFEVAPSEISTLGLIILVMSVITLILSRKNRRKLAVIVTAGISLTLLFIFAIYMFKHNIIIYLGPSSKLQFVIACDEFSLIILLNTIILGMASLIASYRYVDIYGDKKGYTPYHLTTLIFIYSMALIPLVRSWLWFLFLFEIMTLASYFLIGYEYYERDVAKIAWNYFVLMHILCTTPLIIAIALTYSITKTFEFIRSELNTIVLSLYLLGFATKSGLFPLHFWLPDAHPVAPSPISALLSGAMVGMGVYGMYRVLELSISKDMMVYNTMMVLAILSTIVGVTSYIRQRDLKRLFAWSTIDNIGWMYIMLAIQGIKGSSTPSLTLAMYILNHGLAKAAAFNASGLVLYCLGTKNIDELRGSYAKQHLVLGLTIVAMFALEGVPPFSFFWDKFGVVRMLLEYNDIMGLLYAIMWCIAFVSFLYIIHQLLEAKEVVELHETQIKEHPTSIVIAILMLLGFLLISKYVVEFLVGGV